MADHLRIAKSKVSPPLARQSGEFVATPPSQRIISSMDELMRKRSATMTMIAGVPGCGKTMALKWFRQDEG